MKFLFLWIFLGLAGLGVVALIFASRRDAKLRRSGVLPPAGQATMADVERLIQSDQRILAIKCYRKIHHMGLAEAKQVIEELARGIKSRPRQ